MVKTLFNPLPDMRLLTDSYRPVLESQLPAGDPTQQLFRENVQRTGVYLSQPIHHEPSHVWKFVTQGPWRQARQSPRMLCSLGVWIVAFYVLMPDRGAPMEIQNGGICHFICVRIRTHRLFREQGQRSLCP